MVARSFRFSKDFWLDRVDEHNLYKTLQECLLNLSNALQLALEVFSLFAATIKSFGLHI